MRPARSAASAVTKDQLEFEVQFARDGDNPGLDKFHVHIRCFAAWEFELDRDDRSTTCRRPRFWRRTGIGRETIGSSRIAARSMWNERM